jgi:hypothetical protein
VIDPACIVNGLRVHCLDDWYALWQGHHFKDVRSVSGPPRSSTGPSKEPE